MGSLSTTNSKSNGPDPNDTWDTEYFNVNITAFGIIFVLIGFIGIVGNILVVVAVLTDGKMRRSAMNILLVNLACADLGNLIVCTPDIVQKLRRSSEWILPNLFCPLIRYLQIIFLYTSLLTQVAVCIERYFAIAWPMKVRVLCTRRKVVFWTVTLWIFGSISALPYFIFNNVLKEKASASNVRPSNRSSGNAASVQFMQICSWQSTEQFDLYFKCVECLAYYFIPLLIIITLYTKVSFILWNKQKALFHKPALLNSCKSSDSMESVFQGKHPSTFRRNIDYEAPSCSSSIRRPPCSAKLNPQNSSSHLHNYSEMLKSRQSVIKMLVACGFVYFLGYSPVQIIFLAEILFDKSFRFSLTMRLLLNCLAYSCSAANPLLYSIFSQKFRDRFVEIARCQDRAKMATGIKKVATSAKPENKRLQEITRQFDENVIQLPQSANTGSNRRHLITARCDTASARQFDI